MVKNIYRLFFLAVLAFDYQHWVIRVFKHRSLLFGTHYWVLFFIRAKYSIVLGSRIKPREDRLRLGFRNSWLHFFLLGFIKNFNETIYMIEYFHIKFCTNVIQGNLDLIYEIFLLSIHLIYYNISCLKDIYCFRISKNQLKLSLEVITL